MKKRLLAVMLAGVFALSMAGCGSGSTTTNETETKSASEKTVDDSYWTESRLEALSELDEELDKDTERINNIKFE